MNALAYFGFPSNSLFRQHMAPAMEMFTSYKFSRIVLFSFVSFVVFQSVILEKSNKKSSDDANEKWKKKDIRDYTEADLERLYDQWEVAYLPYRLIVKNGCVLSPMFKNKKRRYNTVSVELLRRKVRP